MAVVNGSRSRDDVAGFSLAYLSGIKRDFGAGYDRVGFGNREALYTHVRLSFTSDEVGNGTAVDTDTYYHNEDVSFAVRVQGANAAGELTGPTGRFDDEGISFVSDGTFTFEVRELETELVVGKPFDIVRLGTSGADYYAEGRTTANIYINGGQGDDVIKGGRGDDFLVGGVGNDTLSGGQAGDNTFIGGLGDDNITGNAGNDVVFFNYITDGNDTVNLGKGEDLVIISGDRNFSASLDFDANGVGNRSATHSTDQGEHLAIELRLYDLNTNQLVGGASYFDDEGITFMAVDGAQLLIGQDGVLGAQFGTNAGDTIDRSAETTRWYINGGAGNDIIVSSSNISSVTRGGAGDDRIFAYGLVTGGEGSDTFVYNAKNSSSNANIFDFVSGTDKIDLTEMNISMENVFVVNESDGAYIIIDSDIDGVFESLIILHGATIVTPTDFIL